MSRMKPTALLKIEKGKLYSDQRDRAALEPQPKREITPRCPRRFSKEERKVWKNFAAILDNYGLFTAANGAQLELLTTAWSQYLELSRLVASQGIIVKEFMKGDKRSEHFMAQHQLAKMISMYCQAIGLSSVALAKLGSLALKAKKERDEFFD